MKKFLMLGAAFLAFQALPVMAQEKEGGKAPRGDHGAKFFEKQDTNKDGAIDEAEAMAFAKARFTEIDADKDGKVTKDEMKAHHEAKKAKWKEKREQMKKEKEAGQAPKQ